MTEYNKTLLELWYEVGEKPFVAEVMLYGKPDRVFVGAPAFDTNYFLCEWPNSKDPCRFAAKERIWKLAKIEVKPVPHWPALGFFEDDKKPFMSDGIFPDLAAARIEYPRAVRLITEWPAIMVVLPE